MPLDIQNIDIKFISKDENDIVKKLYIFKGSDNIEYKREVSCTEIMHDTIAISFQKNGNIVRESLDGRPELRKGHKGFIS